MSRNILSRRGGLALAVASLVGGTAFSAAPSSSDPAPEPTSTAPEVAVEPGLDPSTLQRLETALRPAGATGGRSEADRLFRVSTTGGNDLPDTARRAYRRAAATTARTDASCALPWTLLAGIGRVETDHGRYDGARLGRDGISRPLIRGLPLNGVGPVAAIADTDGGRLDGDRRWDRAVGPMQFIPSTWARSGRDGDGDGTRDPDDLDDAALAAAGYLCRAGGDLSTEDGLRIAVFAYNHSDYYVDLVLAFETGYRTGVFDLPSPPVEEAEEPADLPGVAPGGGRAGGAGEAGESREGRGEGRPSRPPRTPQAPAEPAPTTTPGGGSPKGNSGNGGGSGNSGGNGNGNGNGGGNGGGNGNGGGGGGNGKGNAPTPAPAPQPRFESLSGVWTICGGGWCLSGAALDLSPLGSPDGTAVRDYDGDGRTESNRDEYAGLNGAAVTVTVMRGTRAVYGIG